MINLATRQATTWTIAHHDHIPVAFGSLSLTGDGSRLGFVDGQAGGRGITDVFVLPTDSPSGPIMRHATSVVHVPTGLNRVVLSNDGAQAYVEAQSAAPTHPVLLSQYSTSTGRRVRVICRLRQGGHPSVFSVTMDAAGQHLLAYGDAHQVRAVDLSGGQQSSATAARIPFLDSAYDTAAW
jgi:hypothetical protein